MEQIHCGLLYGGRSGEHEVSLRSAASIFRYLDRNKYFPVPVGISKTGDWFFQTFESCGGPSLPLEQAEENRVTLVPGRGFFVKGAQLRLDFIFPVLHGTFGEDGTLQGLLDLMDIPYAGPGVLASALGMDKEKAKFIWHYSGLPVVPSVCLSKTEYAGNPASALAAADKLSLPLFVKPVCAGSSVGIAKVKSAGDLHAALSSAFEFDTRVLIEKAVSAREIECSVVGSGEIRVFPPGEVIPRHEFYDYSAKYTDPDGAEFKVPARLTAEESARIREIAAKAYQVLDMSGMARIDFFIEKHTGEIFINEINTIPGFTDISMFPRMCEAAGLLYPELLDRLIELGFERHREREALRFSL